MSSPSSAQKKEDQQPSSKSGETHNEPVNPLMYQTKEVQGSDPCARQINRVVGWNKGSIIGDKDNEDYRYIFSQAEKCVEKHRSSSSKDR